MEENPLICVIFRSSGFGVQRTGKRGKDTTNQGTTGGGQKEKVRRVEAPCKKFFYINTFFLLKKSQN